VSKFDEDDMGLPENPIYSDYSSRLWKSHARHGSVQSPRRSHLNTDGPWQSQDALSHASGVSKSAAGEGRKALVTG
jgi:hypothetical protein